MSPVTVSFDRKASIESLRSDWLSLSEKANPNCFLTWDWIGNWLQSINTPYIVCKAEMSGQIVGLGVLVEKNILRNLFVRSKTLYLHKTGDQKLDQIWIEYNDFLLDQKHETKVRQKFVEQIEAQLEWDELVIGASTNQSLRPYRIQNLQENLAWHSHSYQVDLAYLRKNKLDYLATLSKNTRYQITRSLKIYKQQGPVLLEVAKSAEQALQWFAQAAAFHIKRWQNTMVGSGFSNPSFVQFHERLIRKNLENRRVDVIKVSAGDTTICYLYNFIQGNELKFYLSANNFEETVHGLKPGLVGHYLAIQHYLAEGFDCYDFMAGESQYKRSLASKAAPIFLCVFNKKKVKFSIEHALKRLKKRIFAKNTLPPNLSNTTFILTGGKENTKTQSPSYEQAKIIRCEVSKSGILKILNTADYKPPQNLQSQDTNVIFKAGSICGDHLNVVTETEFLQYKLPMLEISRSFSHKSFNDLHHVIEKDGEFFVVNTGLDCVSKFTFDSKHVTHVSALSKSNQSKLELAKDYRQIASTKPHLAHPNHAFILNNEVWLTRCDLMDAVCLSNPEHKITIGRDLVHDGVVDKNRLFFTTVDGQVSVYDTRTLSLKYVSDLKHFLPQINGWCRGVLPISSNLVLIGISKTRQSKRRFSAQKSHARVILIDIYKHQLVWEINASKLGMDAIFSILPGDKF